jgi:EAL domain-containing protein (putative c-di-GMP-specific phosphodiesterase class I)
MAEKKTGPHVLLVEEQKVPRGMMAKMIRDLGASEVHEADSAESALEILNARQAPVALLVTDVKLPGMDGVAFIRRVAEKKLAQALILTSALDMGVILSVETMAKGYGMETLGHVGKPVKPEELKPLLVRYLARRAAAPLLRPHVMQVTPEDLRLAIAERQFVPFFQPRVTAKDGKLTALEALVRWNDPERGFIPPGAFIPLADRYGLMDGITDIVLERSIEWCRKWIDAGLDVAVSVNLTENALNNHDLPERVAQLANASSLDRGRIVLEVTEDVAITEDTQPIETLARFRVMGFQLSIDDFGTGMGTAEQLSRIPFTEVKIDQALITGVFEQPQFRGVLEFTLKLAKRLKLKTVAEGIESKEDWDLLKQLGCDEMQGYFIAKPMPGEEIEAWAKEWAKR